MFNEDGLHTTSYSEHNMDEVDSLNSDVVTMPLPANIDSGTNEPPPSIEHHDGYASPGGSCGGRIGQFKVGTEFN